MLNNKNVPMAQLQGEIGWYADAYQQNNPEARAAGAYYWPAHPGFVVPELFAHYDGPRSRCLIPGCGDGPHVKWALEMGFQEVVGVDFIPAALETAGRLNPQAQFQQVDLTEAGSLNSLGEFDLVVVRSVIDHMRPGAHRTVCCENIAASVALGGYLILEEFAPGLVGIVEGETSKEVGGHYSCVYTHEELHNLFLDFQLVAGNQRPISEEHSETLMNGLLLRRIQA